MHINFCWILKVCSIQGVITLVTHARKHTIKVGSQNINYVYIQKCDCLVVHYNPYFFGKVEAIVMV